MKELTYLQEQLAKALLYKPEDIGTLIAQSQNKGYAVKYLNKLFPYRIGVEIDALGWDQALESNSLFTTLIREDKQGASSSPLFQFSIDYRENVSDGQTNEIRMSVVRYNQLKNMKKILEVFTASKMKLASNGGLHVHIDMGDDLYLKYTRDLDKFEREYKIVETLNKYSWYLNNTVARSQYSMKGDKASSKSFASYSGGAISIFRNKRSIEYRLAVPTFEYSAIMKMVLCYQQMTKAIRLKHKFDKDLCDAILLL